MLCGKKLGKKMLIFELNFDLVLFPIVGTIFSIGTVDLPRFATLDTVVMYFCVSQRDSIPGESVLDPP